MSKKIIKKLMVLLTGLVMIVSSSTIIIAEDKKVASLYISITITKDDEVLNSYITPYFPPQTFKPGCKNKESGDYLLEILSFDNKTSLKCYYNLDFTMYSEEIGGVIDSDDLLDHVVYDPKIAKILLYHADKLVFSSDLNFCDNDDICEVNERFGNCPEECPNEQDVGTFQIEDKDDAVPKTEESKEQLSKEAIEQSQESSEQKEEESHLKSQKDNDLVKYLAIFVAIILIGASVFFILKKRKPKSEKDEGEIILEEIID